jgi:large subunit ribosomal protein L1
MKHTSKRYRAALDTEGYERHRRYAVGEALEVLARFPRPKFDETVELAVRLGIDPSRSDQMVRGSVALPNGIGKSRTVAVFAEGDSAREAEEAGADHVGSDDLAKRIAEGWTDFDVCIAHPGMMRHVGKLGKVLGPQGKMPSPKSGTVTEKVAEAVREFKGGKIEFRTDKGGNVHVPVGKRSFAAADLETNIRAFLDHIRSLRPPAVKGTFVRRVSVSATMCPGLVLDES